MLNNPLLMTVAATEAAQACVVVIATESASGLPGGVKSWLKDWCSTKPASQAVVVLLLSEHSGFSAALCPDYSYLETNAAAGGRHLIAYAAGWSPEDNGQFCLAAARLLTPTGLLAVQDFPELATISGHCAGK